MGGENLSKLLSQLNVQSSKEEHETVEELCDQLLKQGCTEPVEILRRYLVALIMQDKYEKGLAILKQYKHVDEKAGRKLSLEKLYLYYKLNMKKVFEELLNQVLPDSNNLEKIKVPLSESVRGILHVKAQFNYKNGDYENALKTYQFISGNDNSKVDNELELACNERISLSFISYSNQPLVTKDLNDFDDASYDLLFNESFILSSKGDFDGALNLLQLALNMAHEENVQSDIDTIELQLAYVYQTINKNDVSKKILHEVLSRLEVGSPLYYIAKMNLMSFNDIPKYSNNMNLLLKKLNYKEMESINLKNFTYNQWQVIQNNFHFLRLFSNNSIQRGNTLISRIASKYQHLIDDTVLLTYKTQATQTYNEVMKNIFSGTKGCVVGTLLLAIQLQILEKNWDNAIRLAETFLDKAWSRNEFDNTHYSICYVLIKSYENAERIQTKYSFLNKVVALKDQISLNIIDNIEFWTFVGFQYLSIAKAEDARKIFNQILETNANTSEFDLIKSAVAEGTTFSKSKGENLVANIDIENIINSGLDALTDSSKKKTKKQVTKVTKAEIKRLAYKKSNKEKKLKKFLENKDLTQLPDPERWIKLKDRSTYKSKQKQRTAKQTQGGAVNKKDEQALDITKRSTVTANKQKKKPKKKGKK